MNTLHTEIPKMKAFLVSIYSDDITMHHAGNYLLELESLVDTMGLETAGSMAVPLKTRHPAFFTGTGKADEISAAARESGADCIVFDDDLTPAQQRNWERLSGLCVIDRHEVILDIFANRASTREAVLQVGLARMEYSLPRLKRAWTHLSRQRGGTKGTRGEGETQLEMDRRSVLRKISRIRQELKKVHSHRSVLRKQRVSVPVPTGAIVGYTNSGKSSLLNLLTGADAFVENRLFATLDPTTRRAVLPGGRAVLLTDTVGFIRKLPHDLVEAFKSTLEETKTADFLIHLIDASNPEFHLHYNTTIEVLGEMGIDDKPALLFFNKIDALKDEHRLSEIKTYYPGALFLSVKTGRGLEQMLPAIETLLNRVIKKTSLLIPPDRYDLVALVHRTGKIFRENTDERGYHIEAALPEKQKKMLSAFEICEPEKILCTMP